MKEERSSHNDHTKGQNLVSWIGYAWGILLPLPVYWPIGSSIAPGASDFLVRPGLFLSDLAFGGLILASLYLHRPMKNRRSRWDHRLTVPFLSLVALGFITIPSALSSTLAAYTAVRWLLAAAVYLTVRRSDWSLERWVTVFVIGLAFQASIGLAQVVKQGPLGLPEELALEASVPGASILAVGGVRWLRAYGLTVHPNVLGGFLAAGLLSSLPLLNRRKVRCLWWLLELGLLFSFSRSAWLATGLVLPPLAFWLARHRPALRRPLITTLIVAVLIALLVGALLAGQMTTRLRPGSTPTESRSLIERGRLIAFALRLIARQPLTGVGAGNFTLVPGNPALRQPVHNVPLLLAAEVGLAGAGLWFWLWLAPGLALNRRQKKSFQWSVVLAAIWFAWGIIGLWDGYPWAYDFGRLFSATLLGLSSRVPQTS